MHYNLLDLGMVYKLVVEGTMVYFWMELKWMKDLGDESDDEVDVKIAYLKKID